MAWQVKAGLHCTVVAASMGKWMVRAGWSKAWHRVWMGCGAAPAASSASRHTSPAPARSGVWHLGVTATAGV